MISDTGTNLSVLIVSEASVTNEWMAYAAWYSFFKNAPDAKVAISCLRTNKRIHQLMNWANRLKISYAYHNKISAENETLNKVQSTICSLNRGFIGFPLLIIDADVLLVRELDLGVLQKTSRSPDSRVWFLDETATAKDIAGILDSFVIGEDKVEQLPIEPRLCVGTKEKGGSLVNIHDGMGRFNTQTWIDKNKGCPFGKAFRFHKDDMTLNEKKVLELWGQMAALFRTIF